jgi:hypothetical protein
LALPFAAAATGFLAWENENDDEKTKRSKRMNFVVVFKNM